jgi:uncharacterized protein (TIGR00369 family)
MTDSNRVKKSFNQQGLMKTLGASLESVENGSVTITASFHESLTQQHGYFHAGVLTSLADSACGYAALSALPDDYEVLTVEFKSIFSSLLRQVNLSQQDKLFNLARP